jgi:signal peptidase I
VTKSRSTYLGGAALAVVAVIAWLLVGPSQLGGPVTYVAVTGNSMEPGLHTGDLVIVRKAPSYQVGDEVAYRNPQLRTTVLHRIVRVEDDRYVFQGDNNDFVDTFRAGPEDIVGRRWILIGGAGKIVQFVRGPVGAALVVMIIALVVMGGSGKRKGKAKKSGLPAGWSETGSWLHLNRSAAMFTAAAAAGVFGLLGMIAFTRPTTGMSTSKVPYTESGKFTYEAVAEKGPVYPDGRVATGQPIYLELVDEVEFAFDYSFDSSVPHGTRGTGSLKAQLSDGNGWARDFELVSGTSFEDDHWRGSGTVRLDPIRALVKQVQSSTGVVRDFYTLSIVPSIKTQGRIGTHDFTTSFSPRLSFQVGALEMQVAPGTATASATPDGGDALRPSQGGSLILPLRTPSTLSMPGLSLDVSKARVLGVTGAALSLLLLALIAFMVKAPKIDEPARIATRFAKLIIPVGSVAPAEGVSKVRLNDIDALVALARRYDQTILHQHDDGVHRYLLENDGTLYSYVTRENDNGNGSNVVELASGDAESSDLYAPFDRVEA